MTQINKGIFSAGALGLVLALSACGSEPKQASPDQVADKLDQAAAQSDPQAAEVMTERADQIRGMESTAPLDDPNSAAQQTMREAGAAQTKGTGQ